MAATKTFLDVVKGRRSRYALTSTSPISDTAITDIVNKVMLQVPSAFNSQTVRTAVLLGAGHQRFWKVTTDTQVGNEKDEERKKRLQGRLSGFGKAYGTIVFFDDEKTLKEAMEKNAAYAHLFPEWAQHTQGMHQFSIWAALDAEGFGANLQHYQHDSKSVDAWRKEFDFPADWKPYAQLVFGGREDDVEPAAKPKLPLEQTVKVITS